MLISYPAISQFPLKVDKKEQYRIIAKIDTKIVSNNTLTVKTGAIKSFDIQELFKRFKVKKIHSVFRNRYNDEGKLKNLPTLYSLSG